MKYWVYLNGEVPGSYTPEELAAMSDFNDVSMVCPAEGGISERNWQRAGEFPEIIEALTRKARPASPPPADAAPAAVQSPDDILSNSSAKIFSHVTELMKEFENRREERALTQSLQRQLAELKNELLASRERIKHLEGQAALIPGFEDRERKLQEFLSGTRHEIKERNHEVSELNRQLTALRQEMERIQRSERSLSEDLKHQSLVKDDFARQLAQKELTLAKAFGVIRKLEEMLGGMVPAGLAPTPAEALPQAAPAPAQEPASLPQATPRSEPPAPSQMSAVSFTSDSGEPESPQTPPEGEVRPVQAPWQAALRKISSALRKPIPLEDQPNGQSKQDPQG